MKLKQGQVITAAQPVDYDWRTDVRKSMGPPYKAEELEALNKAAHEQPSELENGLKGWPPYTHTLFVGASAGWVYHISIGEEPCPCEGCLWEAWGGTP